MASNEYFNLKNLSLDQWKIKLKHQKGVPTTIPALDKHWAKNIKCNSYDSLITSCGEIKKGVDLEEWIYKTERFQRQLELLLNLQHHEFWSTMVYESSALASLVSFLEHVTPFYKITNYTNKNRDNDNDVSMKSALQLYEQLLNCVVRIIWRLLTTKESEAAWLTAKHHKDLLYDNFLITIPMLFDLIIALGNCDRKNVEMLQKIFTNLFNIEPNYLRDLQDGLAYYESAFASIQVQVDNEGCEGAGGGALCDDGSQTPYDDVVLYTLDCAYTLSILLEVCPQSLSIATELKLDLCLMNFYDNTLPRLFKYIHAINPNANSLQWLNEGRQQYLNAFRCLVKFYIDNILAGTKSNFVHQLIELLSECLTTNVFVVDYQRQYPVEIDLNQLQKACPEIKQHKTAFIIKGFKKALSSDTAGAIFNDQAAANSSSEAAAPAAATTKSKGRKKSKSERNSKSKSPSSTPAPPVSLPNRDIDLEVSAILDILPGLGTGFIRRLLARYANSEEALSAIFDENLPPDLANCDRNEVYIPPDLQDKLQQETGLQHYNVFDGDEYDIMTNSNPKCIIKKGKGFPGVPQSAEQLLDDKKELQAIKHRYQEYTLVEETDDQDASAAAGEYDDEYDDSYDAILEGPPELNKRKVAGGNNKVFQTRNENYDNDDGDEDDDDDDGDNDEQQQPQRDKGNDFCENPEDVRARYAARQQAKWGNKAAAQSKAPARDVVGTTKGKGQSNETSRSRAKKEANKSSRANHNRKSGAAFKRSKGMIS